LQRNESTTGTGTAQPGFDATAEAGDTDRPDGADDNPYDEGIDGKDAYGTALSGEKADAR
jgi:hypothetical protein